MNIGKKTALYDAHIAAGASMVRQDGWELPSQYPEGPEAEHLWTRSQCSICDFSHLSRISIAGADALLFLQRVLTSNVAALELGRAQYSILSNENGCALDEGYLYRFEEGKYLFVGNSAPRERTLTYLREAGRQDRVTITDDTFRSSAIAVQGPASEEILKILSGGREITDRRKGSLNILELEGHRVWIGRTGYTGGSSCYEAYLENADARWFWERLQTLGARPAGLTARDMLRIEAGLPHFGQEFGLDREGKEVPIFAVPQARFAVSFAKEKGDYCRQGGSIPAVSRFSAHPGGGLWGHLRTAAAYRTHCPDGCRRVVGADECLPSGQTGRLCDQRRDGSQCSS